LVGEVGFAGFGEFGVPFFSEAGGEGLFEELVEAYAEFAAEFFGRAAYFPAVVVDSCKFGVFGNTDRVEVTGDRLAKVSLAFAVCFFQCTLAHAVRSVTGENAVFAIYDTCHKVALLVDVSYAAAVYLCLRLWEQVVPHLMGETFQAFVFRFGYRSSGIAFDATFAVAAVEVAAEKSLGKVETYEYILYVKHDFFVAFGH
jgi:hypothetical protein